MAELEALVCEGEGLGGEISFEDILTFPILRNLTVVRGIQWPQKIDGLFVGDERAFRRGFCILTARCNECLKHEKGRLKVFQTAFCLIGNSYRQPVTNRFLTIRAWRYSRHLVAA